MSTSGSTVSGIGTGPKHDKSIVANGNGNHLDDEKTDGLEKDSDIGNEKGVVADAAADEANVKPPPRNAHGFAWVLIVASILMANFLFATDNTIAANIQPAVIQTFESLNKLAWLGVAFMMSSWGTCFFW